MKPLHPITGRDTDGTVRVLVVVRGYDRHRSHSSGYLARAYLELVAHVRVKTVMVCDSALRGGREPLASGVAAIKAGDIDLVIATDLSRIARSFAELKSFLQLCAAHQVRVICFESDLDAAEAGWEAGLIRRELVDPPFRPSQEGGAA
jgi:hypothetical protein